MIPQEKLAPVNRALREAFGATEIEDVREMTKGHGFALVLRIVVQGRPYLLRIIMRGSAMLGPERQFTCMKAAVDAGLAPPLWYANTDDQVSLMDYVEEAPFPATEALVRIPALLRDLHALPPFPAGVPHLDTTCMFLMHKGPAVDGFLSKLQEANIFSAADAEQFSTWHAQLSEIYARLGPDLVSSHNDLFKPDNILFDGNRVWLVDWEAAFLNDRYADLAVAANLIVTNDAEERLFLQHYFGQPPDPYQLARFFFTQQIAHLFYAAVFLWQGSSHEPRDQPPAFTDFYQRLWSGEINLSDKSTKRVFGQIHWERLQHNMRQPRWNQAVKILSERHA